MLDSDPGQMRGLGVNTGIQRREGVIGGIVGLVIIHLLGITSSLLCVMNQNCPDFIHKIVLVHSLHFLF